jgi:hypothetical protein
MARPTRVLVIRAACELGKFPSEVEAHFSMDDLTEFAGYLALQNPEREKSDDELSVEEKLVKTLGKPE